MIEDMILSQNKNLFNLIMDFNDGMNYWPSKYQGPWSQLNHFEENLDFKIKYTTGIHLYRFLTIIDKKRNPEDVWAKARLESPDLCKNNELKCYGKILNDWSHLSNKSLVSQYGAHKKYGN